MICYFAIKEIYTLEEEISGIRVSQLPEIQPFFILGGGQ